MTTDTAIPVLVTSEAAARIAELGFQAQIDRMLDYARQLPEVVQIEVVLNERYDMSGEPGVAIDVQSRSGVDVAGQIFWAMAQWMTTEFPPQVLEHLHMSYLPGALHAG